MCKLWYSDYCGSDISVADSFVHFSEQMKPEWFDLTDVFCVQLRNETNVPTSPVLVRNTQQW